MSVQAVLVRAAILLAGSCLVQSFIGDGSVIGAEAGSAPDDTVAAAQALMDASCDVLWRQRRGQPIVDAVWLHEYAESAIPFIEDLRGLRALYIAFGSKNSTGHLEALRHVERIESLVILGPSIRYERTGRVQNAWVGDPFQFLRDRSQVETLVVGRVTVPSGRAARTLEEFSNLQRVALLEVSPADQLLKSLSALPHVEELVIRNVAAPISEEGWKAVGRMQSLRQLSVVGAASRQDFTALGRLPRLACLTLHNKTLSSAGVGELSQVQDLYLSHCYLTELGLASIGRLPALRRLTLDSCWLEGFKKPASALEQLEGSTTLEELGLICGNLGSVSLSPLRHMDRLRRLRLVGFEGDAAEAAGLPNIEELQIRYAGQKIHDVSAFGDLRKLAITRSSVAGAIPRTASLRELDLSYSRVSERLIESLVNAEHLTSLKLTGTKDVSDRELRGILKLTSLQDLDVSNTGVTGAGMRGIADLSGLRTLRLGSTSVNDACLMEIARLPSLRRLDLSSTLVTDEGLSHIVTLADLEVVNLSGLTGVSDIGLSKLSALHSLAFVDLRRTPVTAAGASRSKIPCLRTGSSFPMKNFFSHGEDRESWNGSGEL